MKYIGYTIYTIFILIMGLLFNSIGKQSQLIKYYEEKASDALEEKDFESYLDAYMTYNLTSSYNNKPLYHASSNNDIIPFDFFIFQAELKTSTEKGFFNYFYFYDNLESYDHLFTNNESIELFYKNQKLAHFVVKLYMDDEAEPTETPIYISLTKNEIGTYSSTSKNKAKNKPLALTYNLKDTNNEDAFGYVSNNDKGNITHAKTISKIEIDFVDFTLSTSPNDKPKRTPLVRFDHNDLANNENDSMQNSDEYLISSTNFNGNIKNYLDKTNFTDSELTATVQQSNIKEFKNIRTKWTLIYILFTIIVTFILFFLRPTIDFFVKNIKRKKLNKHNI